MYLRDTITGERLSKLDMFITKNNSVLSKFKMKKIFKLVEEAT